MAQKTLYDAILKHDLRDYLIKRKSAHGGELDETNGDLNSNADQENTIVEGGEKGVVARKTSRALKAVSYKDTSDRAYFASLGQQQSQEGDEPITDSSIAEAGKKFQVQSASK